jgi:glycosyltransferase involved in cell wall biosynthesis
VPEAEIAGWFGAADAAVLPYRRIEQSGVAGLALAFGTPVLASQVGGLDELFAGSPWTFPARSPERLARTITRFLGSQRRTPAGQPPDARAASAGQHGRQAAELSAVAAATLDVYAVTATGSAGGLARVG